MGIGSDVAFGSLKSGLYEMWGKERRGDKEWGGGVVERKGMEVSRSRLAHGYSERFYRGWQA